VQRLQQSNEELREIRELRFKPEDFAAQVKTTDDAIKSFYESNRTQFETPETVKAEYLVLTLDDIASQIAVPEQELKDYYEQNKTRYGEAEQRRASHILFTVGDKGSAPTKDAARKLAEEVRAQLKANPGDFAKLAREYSKDPGSAANGGDLGFFGRNMMVKPFEEAAFALKQGEVSDVVETDFGFHIIRVTEIKPEQTKPFDAVRADIEREFRRQQAQKKFAEAAEQFTNTVYEQADSLQPAADKLKLKVQTVDSVTRQGASGADPQVFTPAVLSALFSADSIKNRRNTEAIEVGGNTLVSARIADHRPAAMRPLEEVRDAIKARVERAEAARLARETGAKKLEDLRKSPSDTGFGAPRTVGRNESQGLPANAINTIMQVPADKLPTYVGTTLDGDTYAVVRVLSARMPEKVDAERRTAQLRAWAQQLGAADDAAYLDALKNKHKARVLKSDLQPASSAADEDKQSDAK
jgi:peptidyl-prolyl cis-trans isomerase D